MASNVSIMPNLGKTWYGDQVPHASEWGATVHHEGTEAWKDDIDPGVTGVQQRRSNRQRLFVLVRNTSGGALLPREVIKFQSGFIGKRVDGYPAADGKGDGVVDENLPAAGVQANDLFWVCIEGPHLAKIAASAIAAETLMIADAAGVAKAMGAPIDATAARNQAINMLGRVIKASVATDTQILVDLNCRR